MKTKTSFCFVVLLVIVSGLNASDKGPAAVSPGSDVGVAVVGENCPTFSWTAVDWALEYKIEVFETASSKAYSYEEMAANAYPILSEQIKGRALSWTPSSDQQLSNGGLYVWYVQAKDAYGTAEWSEGKVFKVDVMDRLLRIEEKLSEILKAKGLSDEVISDVLREIDPEWEDVAGDESGSQSSGYKTQDKIGIQGNEVGWNTWYGEYAGMSLTTGSSNTFIGQFAGQNTSSGSYNTFMGRSAGRINTTGDDNTFIGRSAGYNSNANANTFIGCRAGIANTTGYRNTIMGQQAGYKNTTGYYNTFIGQYAGYTNADGDNNTFIGYGAGYNSLSDKNTFIGGSAGLYNVNGHDNTFIGYSAGYSNESGSGNIFLGYYAGYNETGSNKLYIHNSGTNSPLIYGEFENDIVAINGKLGVGTKSPGYNLEVETSGENAIFLLDRTDGAKAGYAVYSDKALLGTISNHPLMLGVNYAWKMRLNSDSSLVMSNGAQCTSGGVWQDASSRAYKENIQDLTVGEAKNTLLALNPVKYNYKKDKEDEHLGFIAEDVPELVATKERKGMSPMDVVAVLTKVVQEQQNTISELQDRIAKLEKRSQ